MRDIAKMFHEILSGSKDKLLIKQINDFFEDNGLERFKEDNVRIICWHEYIGRNIKIPYNFNMEIDIIPTIIENLVEASLWLNNEEFKNDSKFEDWKEEDFDFQECP